MNPTRRAAIFMVSILVFTLILGKSGGMATVQASPAIHHFEPFTQEEPPGAPTLLQGFVQNFQRDRVANSLAVLVLAALLFSLLLSLVTALRAFPPDLHHGWYTPLLLVFTLLGIIPVLDLLQTSGIALFLALVAALALVLNALAALQIITGKDRSPVLHDWYRWATPLIVAGGLAVAFYLGFVETTQGTPICGPTGDCATVQNSPYARLFGVLPVGWLGLVGYLGILAAWWLEYSGPEGLRGYAALAKWGMCLFGVLFSAYLTFLEPFVIGATCMWCLTSAVLMILLLWVATPAAQYTLNPPDEEE